MVTEQGVVTWNVLESTAGHGAGQGAPTEQPLVVTEQDVVSVFAVHRTPGKKPKSRPPSTAEGVPDSVPVGWS